MILKAELNQGVAYLLTEYGAIFRIKISWDRTPTIEQIAEVSHDGVRDLALPAMKRYMQWPES